MGHQIAYAVDQQQLVDVGWIGAGTTTSNFFPAYPGLLAYVDSISDILEEYNVLEVNLEKSADLMIEAGFEKDDEGFWVKDGQRPDADIWAGVPLFGDIAPITAEQLRKGGFDSNNVTPPDVWDGKSDGRARLDISLELLNSDRKDQRFDIRYDIVGPDGNLVSDGRSSEFIEGKSSGRVTRSQVRKRLAPNTRAAWGSRGSRLAQKSPTRRITIVVL